MKSLIDRVVKIMAIMYGRNAEVVSYLSQDKCFLFCDTENQLPLNFDEVECLIFNEIIELDGGCNEKGEETEVYKLTSLAQEKIKNILKDRKRLLLKA